MNVICSTCLEAFERGVEGREACGCLPEWLGSTHEMCCEQCSTYVPSGVMAREEELSPGS